MNHTPAPWRVQPSTRTDQHIIAGKRWIATVSNHDFHPTEEENERTKANAHLIAAAPDLLAALMEAAEIIESTGLDASPARAAIAKAQGE